jgi:hypothetical protein
MDANYRGHFAAEVNDSRGISVNQPLGNSLPLLTGLSTRVWGLFS